jgi:hypothetical protein
VDQFEINALQKINDYIDRVALKAPMESIPELYDGYSKELLTELDLKACGISTVIWATGYTFDYSLVKLPVVDADGYPIQKRGVTRFDGLYFLGMPWLHNRKSGILFGVGDDAAYLAENIAARSTARVPVEVSLAEPAVSSKRFVNSKKGRTNMSSTNKSEIIRAPRINETASDFAAARRGALARPLPALQSHAAPETGAGLTTLDPSIATPR